MLKRSQMKSSERDVQQLSSADSISDSPQSTAGDTEAIALMAGKALKTIAGELLIQLPQRLLDGPVSYTSGSITEHDAGKTQGHFVLFELNNTFVIDRPCLNVIEFRDRSIPKDRFVEYEPSDLEWMIPLGMAPIIEPDPALVEQIRGRINRRHMTSFNRKHIGQ